MALYMMKCRPLQRSKGHSATGLGCYMLDTSAIDPYDQKKYTQESRHEHDMQAFAVSPNDFTFESPMDVFQSIDGFEKRKDATLGKEYEIALQNELTREQNVAAVLEFCEQSAREGLYIVASIHWKDGNPHAHIYESDRTFSVDENGDVKWGKKNNNAQANKDLLERRREGWAAAVNTQFVAAGLDTRIDHRSYKAQGKEFEREIPEGKNPSADVQERNAAVRKAKQQRHVAVAAEAQNEAAQALAKAQELDAQIAKIITDGGIGGVGGAGGIPPVAPPTNLPAVGAASLDAALASISLKKKAPEPEPVKRELPQVVPGLGAMRPKPKPGQDDEYDSRNAPEIVAGLGSIKRKKELEPAYIPSWGNGPS